MRRLHNKVTQLHSDHPATKKVLYVHTAEKVCVLFKYVRFSAVGAILPAVEDGQTTVLLPPLPYREEGRDLLPFVETDR